MFWVIEGTGGPGQKKKVQILKYLAPIKTTLPGAGIIFSMLTDQNVDRAIDNIRNSISLSLMGGGHGAYGFRCVT